MGTSQSAVARLEAGHNDVRISTLERYAAALDQRLEWRLALGPDGPNEFRPNSSWLEERLFERRIVLCRGTLDDALAGRVASELMTLDALGDGAVELQLDCEGASLEAAWTLIDVVDLLGVPVNIVCSGRVEGAAVGLLSAGERRTALAHISVSPDRSAARDLRAGERAGRAAGPPHGAAQPPARTCRRFHGPAAPRGDAVTSAPAVHSTPPRRSATGSSTRSPETRSRSGRSAASADIR